MLRVAPCLVALARIDHFAPLVIVQFCSMVQQFSTNSASSVGTIRKFLKNQWFQHLEQKS
jgi:hypothetical protein